MSEVETVPWNDGKRKAPSKRQISSVKAILMVALAISLTGGSTWYVFSTTSPTIIRGATGGAIGPCTWFVSLDGTTPVAEAMVGGLSVVPGDNVVGTAGQDPSAFIKSNLLSSSRRLCFSGQTFVFTSNLLINSLTGVTISGNARGGTVFQRGNSVSLSASPNVGVYFPLVDIENNNNFTIIDITIDGNSAQNTYQGTPDGGDINLLLYNCTNCLVSNINSNNPTGDGLNIYKGTNVAVSNVYLRSSYAGFDFAGFVVCNTATNVLVSNLFVNGYGHNVELCGGSGPNKVRFTGFSLVNPLLGENLAILEGQQLAFDNGVMNGTTGRAIIIQVGDLTGQISGVTVSNTYIKGRTSEVNTLIQKSGSNPSPQNITFVSDIFETGLYIVQVSTNSGVKNLDFIDTRFQGTTSNQDIFYGTGVSNSTVTGSTFLSNAGTHVLFNGANVGIVFTNNRFIATAFGGVSNLSASLLVENIGYNPQPTSTVTAGASVWTYTNNDPWAETMRLSTVAGISAWSCTGVAGLSIVAGVSSCYLQTSQTMTATWATTAPVFTKVPT